MSESSTTIHRLRECAAAMRTALHAVRMAKGFASDLGLRSLLTWQEFEQFLMCGAQEERVLAMLYEKAGILRSAAYVFRHPSPPPPQIADCPERAA